MSIISIDSYLKHIEKNSRDNVVLDTNPERWRAMSEARLKARRACERLQTVADCSRNEITNWLTNSFNVKKFHWRTTSFEDCDKIVKWCNSEIDRINKEAFESLNNEETQNTVG